MSEGENTCLECGRSFQTGWTVDNYFIHNANRYQVDVIPDSDTCDFCNWDETCCVGKCPELATVLDTESGVDVYCALHWKELCEENGDTEAECEGFCRRLTPATPPSPRDGHAPSDDKSSKDTPRSPDRASPPGSSASDGAASADS